MSGFHNCLKLAGNEHPLLVFYRLNARSPGRYILASE